MPFVCREIRLPGALAFSAKHLVSPSHFAQFLSYLIPPSPYSCPNSKIPRWCVVFKSKNIPSAFTQVQGWLWHFRYSRHFFSPVFFSLPSSCHHSYMIKRLYLSFATRSLFSFILMSRPFCPADAVPAHFTFSSVPLLPHPNVTLPLSGARSLRSSLLAPSPCSSFVFCIFIHGSA